MTHDLFGTPLPISGKTGLLFATSPVGRDCILADGIPSQTSPRLPQTMVAAPSNAVRRWPPPWHAEIAADRRIKRQYKSEATGKMF